ncbi:uncharacterized protein LOC133815684 [Humulus lupulus]|uniref:uncharacterized protein LOC133815684 n=1 Tax=Humulus lupulus TaxID=3486 RepID=UPI002B400B7A|nr:uncharacterized protein LOC133815684 [Humulus lupulus]
MWKNKEEDTLLSFSNNHIDISTKIAGMEEWWLTGLYGEPNRSLRMNTWNLMRKLKEESQLPWCVIGDVNNFLSRIDKRGGNPYPNWLLEGFQSALLDCNLVDLDLVGLQFTWEKSRRTENWIEVWLDRTLVCHAWMSLFQSTRVLNLEITSSDHSPIFLDPNFRYAHKKFHFENAWLREPSCFQIVEDCWSRNRTLSVWEKTAACRDMLEEWGTRITRNFKERIQKCKLQLRQLKGKRDGASIYAYKGTKNLLAEIFHQKEVFWRQRSKQFWLKNGDQNSKFFHASASARRKNNFIHKLQRDDGDSTDWDNGLPRLIEDYF